MYQVLLVDDEPIILSGIKFLINWEMFDCNIVGTARNGQQALEAFDKLHPDIVICDISMPVLSGIEVLKKANESHPEIVFIMLTNYSEFDLARESLRLKAVDYLLKAQLEGEALGQSLSLAIQERKRRSAISKVNFVEDYIHTNKLSMISQNIKKIAAAEKNADLEESYRILFENGCFSKYALLEIILDFSTVPNFDYFTDYDKKRIFEFESDVITKLISNFYPSFVILLEENNRRLVFYIWDIPQAYSESIKKLYDKLNSASENVTQVKLSFLGIPRVSGQEQFYGCFERLKELEKCYYLDAEPFLFYCKPNGTEEEPLALSGIINRLLLEIHSKNITQCKQLFEKIIREISSTNHKRDEAVSFCTELYSVVSSVLEPLCPASEKEANQTHGTDDILQQIKMMMNRNEIIDWIKKLEQSLILHLEEQSMEKSDDLKKALDYIYRNIDKRILLQDVANHINISPNYLSALFKKQYNQSFVDYVNIEKMKHARELIQENKYLIYEISYMLGFENAYYFTKVFKRHVGCTPTEYQWKCKNACLNSADPFNSERGSNKK